MKRGGQQQINSAKPWQGKSVFWSFVRTLRKRQPAKDAGSKIAPSVLKNTVFTVSLSPGVAEKPVSVLKNSGKTKIPQTVTLQVKIEHGQKATKYQRTVPDLVLAYPLRQNFPAQKTTKFSLAALPFAVFQFCGKKKKTHTHTVFTVFFSFRAWPKNPDKHDQKTRRNIRNPG